jgi:hypothetical protein
MRTRTAGRWPVEHVPDHVDAGAGPPAPAIHHPSHAELLQPYEPSARRRIDGIIVSAARPAGNLSAAFQLAATLRAPVVVLCSHEARHDLAVARARTTPGLSWAVVDLREWPGAALPSLRTSGFEQAKVDPHGDLSHKRNLGLQLARLVGWKRLMFLDDDISGLEPLQVEQAAAGLDRFAAVGMPAISFPDNSVACHARRSSGAVQDVFVSGSALVVCEPATDSFFPDVYNEDWLFLAPHLDRREVTTVGSVVQDEYDPFEDPDRAGAQEFGDVLAEGLIGRLHTERLYPVPTRDYWARFLDARARFLADARVGCPDDALAAIGSAQEALGEISPDELVEYVEAWQADLTTWRQWILDQPRLDGLDAALHYLDLAARTERSQPRTEPPAGRRRPLEPLGSPSSRRACGG